MNRFASFIAGILLLAVPTRAFADDPTARSAPWQAATMVTAVAAMGSQVLMPRVFYSDPDATVGWKARWHVSVLAPAMTLTALAFLNEGVVKGALASYRPGCGPGNEGTGNCLDYGSLSSPAFVASSAFAQGTAVLVIDTLKWSDGRLNAGSIAGDVALPLVLAIVTGIGRSAGNWEDPGQVALSSLVGVGFGAITGVAYALLQRPECPYGSGLICW
jgi:hypothetical protein